MSALMPQIFEFTAPNVDRAAQHLAVHLCDFVVEALACPFRRRQNARNTTSRCMVITFQQRHLSLCIYVPYFVFGD